MKKSKGIIVIIIGILIFITYQLSANKEHKVIYKINGYQVEEHLYKERNYKYDLIISNRDEVIIHTKDASFIKYKKIIDSIRIFNKNHLKCIKISYKNKKIESNVECLMDNKQVSVEYLRNNNINIKDLEKKFGIESITEEASNAANLYKNIKIYRKNIRDEDIYILWDYRGIYILEKNEINYKQFIDYDIYENIMAAIVDNYFVLLPNDTVNDIDHIYYYDFHKKKLNQYKMKNKISKSSYINGVINNKIYVTDKKNKKQYTIDISKREDIDISANGNYTTYSNNKIKIVNKYEFFREEQYFYGTDNNQNIGNYSYNVVDNVIYKIHEQYSQNSIGLIKLNNINGFRVFENNILIIDDNVLYSYNEKRGIKKILESNELRYNYKNMYYYMEK